MTDVVEKPHYRGAVNQLGSGAFTAAKGALQLVLLLSGGGLGLLGRGAVLPVRRGLARTRSETPADEVREVEIAPRPSALRSTAVRAGLAAVAVGVLAAGAVAFAKARANKQLPKPAAAPPAVRPSTNGTGSLVTYVDQGSTSED